MLVAAVGKGLAVAVAPEEEGRLEEAADKEAAAKEAEEAAVEEEGQAKAGFEAPPVATAAEEEVVLAAAEEAVVDAAADEEAEGQAKAAGFAGPGELLRVAEGVVARAFLSAVAPNTFAACNIEQTSSTYIP